MIRPMRWYAAWFDRHRTIAGTAVVLMTAVAVTGMLRLGINEQVRDLFRTDAGRLEQLEEIYDDFGADDMDIYIVLQADDVYDARVRAIVHDLAASLRTLREVESVRSILDVTGFDGDGSAVPLYPPAGANADLAARAQMLAHSHPIAAGRLVNADGDALLVVARLRWPLPGVDPAADIDLVQPLRDTLDRITTDSPVTATLAGLLPVRNQLVRTLKREMVIFLAVSATIGAILAMLLFRRTSAVAIITLANLSAAGWTLGLMGLAGELVNPVNMVVPSLVMIIAFTDSVHIMHHIRKELAEGASPRDAARHAVATVGPACGLTSITTAIGFASLVVADVNVIERFGIVAAVGALAAFASVVTIVPLCAGLPRFGRWLTPRAGSARLWRRSYRETALGRVSAFILRHCRVASIIGLLVTVLFAWTAMQLRPTSYLREGVPASSEAAEAVELIDTEFGGLLSLIALVEWDNDALDDNPQALLAVLSRIENIFARAESVNAPLSLSALVASLPGDDVSEQLAFMRFVPPTLRDHVYQPDDNRALVIGFMPDSGADVQEPILTRLQQELTACERSLRNDGLAVTLSLNGTPVAIGQAANLMINDLLTSLALASIVIFGVMTIAFRSLRLGLIGLLPNAFPLFAVASFLVVIGQPLTVTGVITFCVCLGIAVDDTIHVVTRFRQRTRQGDLPHDALHHTMVTVGSALLTTTIVLVGSLGALLFSSMPLVQLFGMIAAVGLAAAYVGDVLILPAIIAWTEPSTWTRV